MVSVPTNVRKLRTGAEGGQTQQSEAVLAVSLDVGWDLAPLDGVVQSRQRLGTQERRCQELVRARDLDPRARQVQDGAGVDTSDRV
jgi:hypothetical protein